MEKTIKIPVTIHTKLRIYISKRKIHTQGEGISQAIDDAIEYERERGKWVK